MACAEHATIGDGKLDSASFHEDGKPDAPEHHAISVIVDFMDAPGPHLEPRIERFDLKDVTDGVGPSRLMSQAKGDEVNVEPTLRWIHIPENDMELVQVELRRRRHHCFWGLT